MWVDDSSEAQVAGNSIDLREIIWDAGLTEDEAVLDILQAHFRLAIATYVEFLNYNVAIYLARTCINQNHRLESNPLENSAQDHLHSNLRFVRVCFDTGDVNFGPRPTHMWKPQLRMLYDVVPKDALWEHVVRARGFEEIKMI